MRRRRTDGVVQIVRTEEHPEPSERYLAMFTVILVANGLFLATAIPAQLLALVVGCCLGGELSLGLRTLLLRRHPRAEVLELAATRWPRQVPSRRGS